MFTKVHQACDICASIGWTMKMDKIPMYHVNTAFNTEIHADLVTVTIRGDINEVINIVDTGIRYAEIVIDTIHRGSTMMRLLETKWFHDHRTKCESSAHQEFSKGFLGRLVQTYYIKIHVRPPRSSYKS